MYTNIHSCQDDVDEDDQRVRRAKKRNKEISLVLLNETFCSSNKNSQNKTH